VEGLGAEAAPRHEDGQGEIDQVGHDRYFLATAEARDHRANKQLHRTGSSQRHQNRRWLAIACGCTDPAAGYELVIVVAEPDTGVDVWPVRSFCVL
jgi:hypothetical protein